MTISKPPNTVKLAVLLIGVNFALGLITRTITAHLRDPAAPFAILIVLTIMVLYVRAIYRGRNWARWFFTILMITGIFASRRAISHFPHAIEFEIYIVQCVIGAAAIVLMFLPASRMWFSSGSRTAQGN